MYNCWPGFPVDQRNIYNRLALGGLSWRSSSRCHVRTGWDLNHKLNGGVTEMKSLTLHAHIKLFPFCFACWGAKRRKTAPNAAGSLKGSFAHNPTRTTQSHRSSIRVMKWWIWTNKLPTGATVGLKWNLNPNDDDDVDGKQVDKNEKFFKEN